MSFKDNRVEYDRLRQQQYYAEFKTRKQAVFNLLGNKCFRCKTQHKSLHLHHVIYDSVESNYPRHSKTMNIRFKRLKEAEKHPERFELLCPSCHMKAEWDKKKERRSNDKI